jgi:ABC-type branched-subunit amino acid transport system ATPase component
MQFEGARYYVSKRCSGARRVATSSACRRGVESIHLAEQNMRHTMDIADHVCIVQAGKVILSRPASEVQVDEANRLYFAR